MDRQERKEITDKLIEDLENCRKRKHFTVLVVTTSGNIIKIENAKQCTSKMIDRGVTQPLSALYVMTTKNETYIFPLASFVYAKLMDEDKA